ncbi:SpoIIE family protein phosphatase [Paracrocinitomix mangrovi]|uniref:SpoIIE family protein phosphatase n=1 Tax=Paracrocinitomix mangrovi TaxID=2862509 RepID=UPI001C8D1624|nr:SpoIIE family protein phosphatase [Paracrocinitomix mangrovi]UKN01933.1 SpoIIE family protein phosphatase [Paracrocinitomix mangrovi]
MHKYLLLLLTIFTTSGFHSFSQRENLPVVNFTSRDYGKEFNPEIYCTVQDKRGVMYMGSGNGLHEFDGTKWNYIKVMAGSYVRALGVDSSGVVYVGSNGDFGFLAPDTLGQLQYNSLLDKLPEEDWFFGEIWAIHCTDKFVYFQAQEAFFVYDLEKDTVIAVYPTDTSSFHTSFLIDGELYLRAREIGIVKYVNGDLERLRGTEMVRDLGVFGLYKLQDDSLLILTQELGIWKWKNDAAVQLPEGNDFPLIDLNLYGSEMLSDGNIAVWTFTSGVYILNKEGKVLKQFDQQSGLTSNDVKGIYEDRENNIWLSTANGVSMVNYYAPFSYYGEKAGISGNIVAMQRFKGQMYVGTSVGLFVQSSDRKRIFENTELLKETVWDFCVVNDRLYMATPRGVLSTTDGKSVKAETSVWVEANAIRFFDNMGIFVVSGPKGIFLFNRNFQQINSFDQELSLSLGIEQDPTDPGIIWVGTVSSGAFRIKLNDGFVVDQFTDFDGLLDDIGKPLMYHDSLVFGCKQGLSYFMDEEEMKKGLTEEEKEDPLNYRGMFQVQDMHSYTTDGQFLFLKTSKKGDWFSDDNYSIGYYDHEKAEFIRMPFKGIDVGRINRFYLEEDGTLWVGGSDGLLGYTHRKKDNYEKPYSTLIRSFTIGGDSLMFAGAFFNDGEMSNTQTDNYLFNIDYHFNDVKFTFSSTYFEYQENIQYAFKLEGYDQNWTDWSKKTEANFTNLNEGDYTFMVKAKNVYDVESEVATFKFTVLPPWYRTAWAYALFVLLLILSFFVGFRLFSLRLKRKNQWLEGVVEERTREIKEKNEVLKHQKQEIEDSINYAQRIQQAILPLEDEMKKWLPNSFVLFRPKDIVSGDFYWFTEKEDQLVFICADCTGHGVPGAFMSMIGSDRLNIIVGERKIIHPGQILSELNIAIKKSLKQDGQTGSTKDGMDAAVCTIDLKTNEVRYAGANRPLWIVQNGDIEEIKATKVAVAGFTPDDQVYEEHVIKIEEGMKFYMTSDGYADQFGGDRGKKLKVKTMKEFILNVCNKDFDKQRDELEKSLIDWMSGFEQIDDVCVVGFEPVTGSL